MRECPYCGEHIEGDPDKVGARCPRCREPLHERAGGPRLVADLRPDDERGACTVHPANVAVGTCQRCGNFLCRVCRTRWEGRSLCLACTERAVGERQQDPEEARGHRRQAVLSLVCGLGAWGMVLLTVLLALPAAAGAGEAAQGLAGFGVLVGATSLLPALFGVGQGAAAVRTRGDRMIIATCGLVLSACLLGVVSGLVLLTVWRQ
jgi:hypothetical protein